MILSAECASFMHEVFSNVWTRLNDVGIDYTFGEMAKHFRDMMNNPKIKKDVEGIFMDQFLYEEAKNEH